jgi:uncharacterized protein YkwD
MSRTATIVLLSLLAALALLPACYSSSSSGNDDDSDTDADTDSDTDADTDSDSGSDLDTDSDSDSDSDSDTGSDTGSDSDTGGDAAECDPYVADWDPDWADFEQQVLDLVNQERSEWNDCGSEGTFGPTAPLTMHPQLQCAARAHSKWMGINNTMTHDSPGGPFGDDMVERVEYAGYTSWWSIGENIAHGQSTPASVVSSWMASDGHCANIMEPDFEDIGVGYYYDGDHWWTQDFGVTW